MLSGTGTSNRPQPREGRRKNKATPIVIDLVDRIYKLETTFLPPGDLISLFSAHTNKPDYMTSHLYVTMPDLEVGQSRSLFVRYDLSVTSKGEDE